VKSIIPLQHYCDQIPEVQLKNMKNDGVKFQTIYNKFVELGIKGARNKNKVRDDLGYYIELGFFIKLQNENHQPLYYQTHIGGDLKTDMYLLEGVKFVKTLLDTKFKKINDEWEKLDKNKLFYKQKTFGKGKYSKPTKKLERWIMLLDSIIVITQKQLFQTHYKHNQRVKQICKISTFNKRGKSKSN
jgi:hypothetical protein